MWAATSSKYEVSVSGPEAKFFHVEADLPCAPGDCILRAFPNTGTRGESEYARTVVHLIATSRDRSLFVVRPDPFSWNVQIPQAGIIHLSYDVGMNTADQLQLDSHAVSSDGGYFDARSLLLYTEVSARLKTDLITHLPAGWTVDNGTLSSGSIFESSDYATAFLSPFLMGPDLKRQSLVVRGVPHQLVFAGPLPAFDEAQLRSNVEKIASYEMELFRGAPFQTFTALFRWRPDLPYGGGIEHRGGMYMNIGKEWMINLPLNMSGTFAHEYFHSWNDERMHPRGLSAPEFDSSGRTTVLWFQEGFANYYSNLTLVRTGIISPGDFYDAISRDMTSLENEASRKYISLADASMLGDSGAREHLDYYAGGEVVAFVLDMSIRQASSGAHSLDDALRSLYQDSGSKTYHGYDEPCIIAAVNRAAGRDLTSLVQALLIVLARPTMSLFLLLPV